MVVSAQPIHYVESLRREPSYYWPDIVYHDGTLHTRPFRPALNLQTLSSLVNWETCEDEDSTIAYEDGRHCIGEKRKPSLRPLSLIGKRRKVDVHNNLTPEPEKTMGPYPNFWRTVQSETNCTIFEPQCTLIPALRWSVDIGYSRQHGTDDGDEFIDDAAAEQFGWLQEENDLISRIEAIRENSSMPTCISLGRGSLTRYLDRSLVVTGSLSSSVKQRAQSTGDRWLLLIPQIPWLDDLTSQELEHYDIQNSEIHDDFLAACLAFQSEGRAKIETDLEMHILPRDTREAHREMPFRLQITFLVSLAIPSVYFEPFQLKHRQKANSLEGLQRRMINLLPHTPSRCVLSTEQSTGVEHEAGDVTIPFFLSILRPAPALPCDIVSETLQPDALNSTLLPFQRRTVFWMLNREGKWPTPDGTLVSLCESSGDTSLPPLWERIVLGEHVLFFNKLSSIITPDPPKSSTSFGGILAEEPGLGKTIECIALILLNPAPERSPACERWDAAAQIYVKEIKTTLIVTPPTLALQWADELATHAPFLKVLIYDGWSRLDVPITRGDVELERAKRLQAEKGSKRGRKRRSNPFDGSPSPADTSEDDIIDWCTYVNQFDVCITTYNVLRHDLGVARAPPKRPRRQDVTYSNLERPRSPLVMCEWYRVIMDEVQMMGVGKSEEMVSLIPRLSSWAVSGTPVRAQVSDLIRVLRFLRVDDMIGSPRRWQVLLKHGFKDQFAAFFQHYAVRTLKSAVKDELTIPEQQRYLVGIELGPVERQVYDQAMVGALAELGLDARGVAAYEGWQVDAGMLRNILRRLRGICTHPQVGQLQRQGDKPFKGNVLKSMSEVLEGMRDQHWRNVMDDSKAKIQALIRLAQLQQHSEQDYDRYKRALDLLDTAEKHAHELIAQVRAAIGQHHEKGDVLKKEARALRESRKVDSLQLSSDGKETEDVLEREYSPDSDDVEEDDVEDRGLPQTPAGEEHRLKRRVLQQRLRECMLVLHRVRFLQGDVHHVLGPSHLEREDACYGDAERLRKDLLRSVEANATRVMRKLRVDVTARGVSQQGLVIATPYFGGGGIRSTRLFEEVDEIIEYQLNKQTALIWQWRKRIVMLLTQKLNNTDDQVDGEEYARTLDTQGEVEVYIRAYATLLADRREAIIAERTLLAVQDAKEMSKRLTRVAKAAGPHTADGNLEMLEDVEVNPMQEVLHMTLSDERKKLYLQATGRALKSVRVDLSAVVASIHRDTDPEKIIAKEGVTRLRALIAAQLSLMEKLDADLAQFRKAFNERIIYFRQLQDISDSVVDVVWDGAIREAMDACEAEYRMLDNKIVAGHARQRYLEHLAKNEDGSMDEDDKMCILCRCEFVRGFITQCAHVFCEKCLMAWLKHRQRGALCPVCRVPVEASQLQRFTIHDERPPPKVVMNDGEPVPVSRRQIEYNMIDRSVFREIQTMECRGSYGSKIQTLVRHLLHIQNVDPGAKSIVFSAWADSLQIIEHALTFNGIPCLLIGRGRDKDVARKFRMKPDLQVLLLHGERDNAGLNITCASRVFLVESVVNHGFEVQAIARIDRIGQMRATEVFCYYAEDTVERNILDLAARQGLSLYTKANSSGSIDVTSLATDLKKLVDAARKTGKGHHVPQKGDFIFKVNDMLAILFPHMFEDDEYLISPEQDELGGEQEEHLAIDHADDGPSSSSISSPSPSSPPRPSLSSPSSPSSSSLSSPVRSRVGHTNTNTNTNAEAGPSRLPM